VNGSLLTAEVHRFRSRRFIVTLLLLAVAAFVVIVAISSTQFAKPSAAGLAEARQKIAAISAEQEAYRADCLRNLPAGHDPQECPSFDASQFQVEDFVAKRPFVLATAAPNAAIGVAAGTAALLFLVGATWIGAEWSTKSMVALLFWEPRRIKVIMTKFAVLVGAAAIVAVASQALWLLAARLLAATRGTSSGLPKGFYGDLLAIEARGVLLGVLGAAFGFALANLVRNTGAALGVGFVYFAVVENAIRILRPTWQPWLLTNNAAGLMSKNGLRLFVEGGYVDSHGVVQPGKEIVIGNLHGGLVLGITAAVLVAVGAVLFARRDLQ
jgi:ABC-type transport system involved in multi-copper enzyme maturation permease subunit